MLASDAHGGFGGIAQFNRDAIDALGRFKEVQEIVVLCRNITERGFAAPIKVRYDLGAARGRPAFVLSVLREAVFGGGFDLVICAHANLSPIALAAARLARAPMMLTVHGIDAWTRPTRLVTAAAMRAADLIVSVSNLTLERMVSWLGAEQAGAVVPNTVRLERSGRGPRDPTLVARYGLEGRRVIMTMGRMAADERAKGFDQIIELMPRLCHYAPDLAYMAVGDGDDRPRLEAKVRALGLCNAVVFTGRIHEATKADHFRLADAYVMASRGEGFGIVVLEALACGIPVVGSTADGTQEALMHGELGHSVDPEDPDALEAAILAAMAQPKQVPERLSYYAFDNFTARLYEAMAPVMRR